MEKNEIPEIVVSRLPIYIQKLNQLLREGYEIVSSEVFASELNITSSQVRKDLSYFGTFGKQGSGYNILSLLESLRDILHLNRRWQVAVVGVGHLGQAILNYQGFARKGFEIVLAFDNNPNLVGEKIGGIKICDNQDLETLIRHYEIKIAILTVPGEEAQVAADRLIKNGVKAILNYAPITLKVPEDVKVSNIDPVLALQNMTFYLED